MKKTVVIDLVALSSNLLGKYTPNLLLFAKANATSIIKPVIPAVTTTVQSTYLTGEYPKGHGIVGNGWYFKDQSEVKFWLQSNHLVNSEKIWETARKKDKSFTCANLFWWYNMYSSVDYSVTPRPMYLADGRKLPDIYTHPAPLRDELQKELGQFPLFNFWGPASSIKSSQWIADSAKIVDDKYDPTLTLIYLPHLDYALQKYGSDLKMLAKDLQEIDRVCGDLINFYQKKGASVIVLSEYSITNVNQPIALNRLFRKEGLLAIREELGKELLDPGASKAFAIADHQIAHIHLNDKSVKNKVIALLKKVKGVSEILDEKGKQKYHLDHPRSGDLVALSSPNAWFSYYYWLDDNKAPDFARTVEIHKKPGYDPVELFLDPAIKYPKLKIGLKLLKKQIGQRVLMDVIPLDSKLVKGSHGVPANSIKESPLFITDQKEILKNNSIEATDVFNLILKHLTPTT